MKRLAWLCCFAIAGCAALANPAPGPGGEEVKNPDGTPRTNWDVVVNSAAGVGSIVGANPLWGTLILAGGALARDKVVRKRAS